MNRQQENQRLKELAQVFLRLGAIAFGGPAAHIAMMDDEVVKRRQWMSRDNLLDLIGVTNLLPGPNSTELAIHIGYERAGWAGLLVAGSCVIGNSLCPLSNCTANSLVALRNKTSDYSSSVSGIMEAK
jgi:chromate transporter